MQRAAQLAKAPAAPLDSALQQAVDDVELKRHRRNPFGDRYVSLATSAFGAAPPQQDGEAPEAACRTAVEAAATNVHVRVELIRTMKNALVKQTQEAVKRAAPAQRRRLGGAGLGSAAQRQAAAAVAAAAAGTDGQQAAEDEEGGGGGNVFADEDMHQLFQQLLQGSHQPNLMAVQEQLLECPAGDASRQSDAEVALDVNAELAPPPFDDFIQQLFGAADQQQSLQQGAAAPAADSSHEEAGLAAALEALRQHTALLEGQGVFAAAPSSAPGRSWLQGDMLGEGHSNEAAAVQLPAYLQYQQQQEEERREAGFQHWPAPAAEAAGAAGAATAAGCMKSDSIQDADDGADWQALEYDCRSSPGRNGSAPLPRPPLLGMQAEPAAGVGVAFDDDMADSQWQASGAPTRHQQNQRQQQQAVGAPGGQGQATLSELKEAPGCGGLEAADPWLALEGCAGAGFEAGPADRLQGQQAQQQQQHPGVPPAASRRVPTFAGRRQPLALSQPRAGTVACGGAWADMQGGEDEEEEDVWDEGMLEQVAALEQQALLRQGGKASQPEQPLQQQQRRAPVFPDRALGQQRLLAGAWPATGGGSEGIEDADSDQEQPAEAEAEAATQPRIGGAAAVPQLGRRAALPLAAAAAGGGDAREPPATTTAATAAAGAGRPVGLLGQRAQRQQAKQLPAEDSRVLVIDFASIDVDALRPSHLLRHQQGGGKPRWKPVYNPEALLLPPLRAALPPPPPPPPSNAQQDWHQQLLQHAHIQQHQQHQQQQHMQHEQHQQQQQWSQQHTRHHQQWQPVVGVAAGPPRAAGAAVAAAQLVAGLTAEDMAGWDDWEDEDEQAGAAGIAAMSVAAAAAPTATAPVALEGWDALDDAENHRGGSTHCQQQPAAAPAVHWDKPPCDDGWQPQAPEAAGTMPCAAAAMAAPAQAPAACPLAPAVRVQLDICFDEEESAEQPDDLEAPGWQHTSSASALPGQHARSQGDVNRSSWAEPAWQQQRQPGAFAAASEWPSQQRQRSPLAADAAAAGCADPWAAYPALPRAPPPAEPQQPAALAGCVSWSLDAPMEEHAAGSPAAAAMTACNAGLVAAAGRRAPAPGPAVGQPDDVWAVLEPNDDSSCSPASAADGSPTASLWGASPTAAGCSPGMTESPTKSLSQLEVAAVGQPRSTEMDGCWGCDIEWEEEGGTQQKAAVGGSGAEQGQPGQPAAAAAAAAVETAADCLSFDALEQADGRALEWAYAEEGEEWEGEGLWAAGLAPAAGTATAAGMPSNVGCSSNRAAAAVGRCLLRHELVGAEIIKALLEERRQSRVDLQPLLQQLSGGLAAALAGIGSTSTDSCGAGAARLSVVRQACIDSGAPGTQASTQRYFLALLTASHQHNTGAAGGAVQGPADSSGRGAADEPGIVAPLVAALGGRQLRLTAQPAASDVTISV